MSDEIKVQKPELFGMITRPREQFERIRENPIIWGAMGIIIVLYILGSYLTSINVDTATMNEFGIDEQFAGVFKLFALIGMIIGGIVIPLLSVLVTSFIFWLVAKIVQSDVSFRQLFSMNTYIMIISAIGLILNGIIMYFIAGYPENLPTSLAFWVGTDGSVLLSNLEIFAIWNVILTAIGLHIVARFSKGLAWSVSIGLYVIGILLSIASAALSTMVN